MQLRDLLLGDLDLLEVGGDLLEGQEPSLLAFGDQLAQLVELPDRRLVGEQNLGLGAHAPIFPRRHAALRADPTLRAAALVPIRLAVASG